MNTEKTSRCSRRRFLVSTSLTAAAICLVPRRLFAAGVSPVITIREEAKTAKITTQKLRGNISVLEGSGGNIAVLVSPEGKLLVDAGITASRPRISEALASLGPGPIQQLINTHWHFDHTDGNEWLHSEGAKITAHENTLQHLSTTTRVKDWNFTFPPAPEGALPTNVFKSHLRIEFQGISILLEHYPPAHTDSDIYVEFPDADIIHVGDTWWNGHFPFIDYSTGGSINGTIHAAEENISKVSDKTIVIPGHGPLGNKAGLIEFRDMLLTVREKVAALKKEGKTVDEVTSAAPTAAFDAKWGNFVIDGKTFTHLVYQGV